MNFISLILHTHTQSSTKECFLFYLGQNFNETKFINYSSVVFLISAKEGFAKCCCIHDIFLIHEDCSQWYLDIYGYHPFNTKLYLSATITRNTLDNCPNLYVHTCMSRTFSSLHYFVDVQLTNLVNGRDFAAPKRWRADWLTCIWMTDTSAACVVDILADSLLLYI